MDDEEAILERKFCDYDVKITVEMARAGKGEYFANLLLSIFPQSIIVHFRNIVYSFK